MLKKCNLFNHFNCIFATSGIYVLETILAMFEFRFQKSRFAVQSTTWSSPLTKNIQAFLKESNIFYNAVDIIFEIFGTVNNSYV